MICVGLPVHNSSKTLENPLLKINIIFEELEKKTGESPYIIVVDDASSEEETQKMLQVIKGMVAEKHHTRLLYMKHSENLGVFSSLNKISSVVTNQNAICSKTEIKAIMFKDHDDYITTANIESSLKIIEEGVLGVPAIKIDLFENDLEDFKIMTRSVDSIEKLKKKETMFLSRFDINSLMYFGRGGSKNFFDDNYKTACVKDAPDYYNQYYDLFNTYALSTYSTKLLKLLGGFDLYSLDSAGSKAYDICSLRVLNLMLKNILRKTEEYFISTEKVKKYSEELLKLEELEKHTRFADLLFKPTIFRLILPDSLSQNEVEKREFFYFTKLKQNINNRKGVYYEMRNLKNSFMFLKTSEVSEIIDYYIRISKHIIQSLYTPIPKSTGRCEILYRGEDWVINEEVQ